MVFSLRLLTMILAKDLASSASVSVARKNHRLPRSVRPAIDDTPVTSGMWFFSATGITAMVAELQNAPEITGTLSFWINFSAALTEFAGLHRSEEHTSEL